MLKSILKRIFYMLIVVWVVSVMAFILMRCAPGDPTATMLPDTASEEQRAALYEQLGLNQPYIIQYLKYMGGLFTGNLGHSTLYNSPVREVIAQRLPATICVSLISAVFVLLISVPIGIISGVTRGSMADFSLMFFVVILQSMSVVGVCAVAPDFCSEAGHSPLHGVLRLIKASVPRHASHRNGLPYVRPSSQNGTFQHDRCA